MAMVNTVIGVVGQFTSLIFTQKFNKKLCKITTEGELLRIYQNKNIRKGKLYVP